MTDAIEVVTTTASRADAVRIAQQLVEQRLAACVQLSGPIVSTYRWQGKIETAEEWQCAVKTHAELYSQVEAAILAIHPYDTPEILATRIEHGSRDYLQWMAAELTQREAKQ